MIFYQGPFNFEIVNVLLGEIRNVLPTITPDKITQRKIFSAAVEVIENICKHYNVQSSDIEGLDDYPCLFKLNKNCEIAELDSLNLIYNNESRELKHKIDYINGLSREELNNYFLVRISEGKISESGNAGLGLIEMEKKSHHKLNYEFLPVNNVVSYFKLKVIVQIP